MDEMSNPGAAAVISVSVDSFQADVIERSRSVPVILLFWADQVPQSVEARQVLEQQANAATGRVLLALVDVAADPTLAQHLRVQGLPAIRVIQDGQIRDQLEGPQPEEAYRQLVDVLTMSGADLIKAQLEQVLAAGDFDAAIEMLQQAVNEEPGNMAMRVEMADVLVRAERLEEARTVLAGIADQTTDNQNRANNDAYAKREILYGEKYTQNT